MQNSATFNAERRSISRSIILEISHPTLPPGPVGGFRFLWAMYVSGYRPDRHCQLGLRGRRVAEVSVETAHNGAPIVLDRMDSYPYVYVCGVGSGRISERHRTNLHFPLRYAAGMRAGITTYNGYHVRALNAVEVPVPHLPRGWHGLPDAFTQCRNFQFAVACFGGSASRGQATQLVRGGIPSSRISRE